MKVIKNYRLLMIFIVLMLILTGSILAYENHQPHSNKTQKTFASKELIYEQNRI